MAVVEICQTTEEKEMEERENRIEIPDDHPRQGNNERIKTLKEIMDRPISHQIILLCCVVAVSLDPLFFYIPIINDQKKCLGMDEKLKKTILVLRSVMDLTYIFHIAFQIFSGYLVHASEMKSDKVIDRIMGMIRRINWWIIIVDILCVLPIPQVVILVYFSKMKGSESLNWRKFLNFIILFQFVPRIFRIYHSCKELTKNLGPREIARAAWVKGLFNFFLYIIASHLFGALWYFFSVQRESACWQQACKRNSMCNQSNFFCIHRYDIVNDPIIGYLNLSCPLIPPSRFDFGMFTPALQSGIVNSMDFPRKFFYCFSWGLRNLSSFGSNLQTSTNFWESLYSTAITVIGLLLFIYLIGNLQTYLQFSANYSEKRRKKMEKKEGEIDKLIKSNDIPPCMRKELMDLVSKKMDEKEEVNLKNVLNLLPTQRKILIKQRLCSPFFKKIYNARAEEVRDKRDLPRDTKPRLCQFPITRVNVPILQNFDAIDDYLIPTSYKENACIVREGEPLDKIIFILQGQIQTYSPDKENCIVEYLKKGQFYGADLLDRVLSNPSELIRVPISTKRVRAHTNVEAFVLSASGLRKLLSPFRKELEDCPEFREQWTSSAAHILNGARVRYIRNKVKSPNQRV